MNTAAYLSKKFCISWMVRDFSGKYYLICNLKITYSKIANLSLSAAYLNT